MADQSKFGGVPVEAQAKSKFGGVAVDEPQAPAKPPYVSPFRNIPVISKVPVLGNLTDAMAGIDEKLVNPGFESMEAGGQRLTHPNAPGSTPTRQIAGGLSDIVRGAGTAMGAPFLFEGGLTRPFSTLAGGLIGTGASLAGSGVARVAGAPPEVSDLAGDVAGATAGPLLSKGIGTFTRSLAPGRFEGALGIRGTQRQYGAEPGKAGLEYTTSVRPGKVAQQAQTQIESDMTDLVGKAQKATIRPSLAPARQLGQSRVDAATASNSLSGPKQLSPMVRQLTEPQPGFRGATEYPQGTFTPIQIQPAFEGGPAYPEGTYTPIRVGRGTHPETGVSPYQPVEIGPGRLPKPSGYTVEHGVPTQNPRETPPGAYMPIGVAPGQPSNPLGTIVGHGVATGPLRISPEQSASDFLRMKQRFGEDFTKFVPGKTPTDEQLGVANEMYHSMADEFNRAVPGGAEINQRIQSLIPVADRGLPVELGASPMDRVLNRVTRPTGGLVGPLLAFGKGGPVAAATMMTAQELAASPSANLLLARGLWNGGKGLASSQATKGALVAPLLTRGPSSPFGR